VFAFADVAKSVATTRLSFVFLVTVLIVFPRLRI